MIAMDSASLFTPEGLAFEVFLNADSTTEIGLAVAEFPFMVGSGFIYTCACSKVSVVLRSLRQLCTIARQANQQDQS